MKKVGFLFCFVILSYVTTVAQDVLYSIGNDVATPGISRISGINPATGAGASGPVTYASGDPTTVSAAMALGNNGYIYYISQADEANGGAFTIHSISADPSNPAPSAPVLQDDINGTETGDVTFRSMAASPGGAIYMTVADANGMYLARFQPGPGGAASGFEMLGTITLDGAPSSDDALFRNGDMAFDGIGNLFVLINEDAPQVGGATNIYFAAAGTLSTSASGNTDLQARYQVRNANNTNFFDFVVGLAIASSGNFYIAVQGGTGSTEGGIYMLSKDANGNYTIPATPVSGANGESIADLATGYFPNTTVLPVSYGNIAAKITGNSLVVNWSTLSETNNDHFEIEVSADGRSFKSIGTVKSKADNGISDKTIEYSFSKSVDVPVAAIGISVFGLALGLLVTNRRNKLLLSMAMIIGVGITFASCSKSSDEIDVDGNGKLLVRIVQVDKDGTTSTSKVITASRAN